jgi:hypothetical protein
MPQINWLIQHYRRKKKQKKTIQPRPKKDFGEKNEVARPGGPEISMRKKLPTIGPESF